MAADLTTQRKAAERFKVPPYVVWVVSDMYGIPTVPHPSNGKAKCYTPENLRRLRRGVRRYQATRQTLAETAARSA